MERNEHGRCFPADEFTVMSKVDAYFAELREPTRAVMEQVRAALREAAPELEETLKYGMPTLVGNGNVVHYAAWRNHFSLYPAPREHPELGPELAQYPGGDKGTVQFPYEDPPLELIHRIVMHLAEEDRKRPPSKSGKK
jgi:uncharacterized protein YdhG (YjbR/CyaY superfamily)